MKGWGAELNRVLIGPLENIQVGGMFGERCGNFALITNKATMKIRKTQETL